MMPIILWTCLEMMMSSGMCHHLLRWMSNEPTSCPTNCLLQTQETVRMQSHLEDKCETNMKQSKHKWQCNKVKSFEPLSSDLKQQKHSH